MSGASTASGSTCSSCSANSATGKTARRPTSPDAEPAAAPRGAALDPCRGGGDPGDIAGDGASADLPLRHGQALAWRGAVGGEQPAYRRLVQLQPRDPRAAVLFLRASAVA